MRVAAMPCYYLHLYDDMTVLDEEGLELPELVAVLRETRGMLGPLRLSKCCPARSLVDVKSSV